MTEQRRKVFFFVNGRSLILITNVHRKSRKIGRKRKMEEKVTVRKEG